MDYKFFYWLCLPSHFFLKQKTLLETVSTVVWHSLLKFQLKPTGVSVSSRRGRWPPFSQGLKVDRQGLFFGVWWTFVLFSGNQVAQNHPETDQQDPQGISQDPFGDELGVGWHDGEKEFFCDAEQTRSNTHDQENQTTEHMEGEVQSS